MKKRLEVLFCCALALVVTPAAAEWIPGFRAGIYGEGSDPFVGMELLHPVGDGRWWFNPNVEWVFVDRGDLFSLNADVHYDLEVEAAVDVWVGGGLAAIFSDHPRRGSETDAGINLLGGVAFRRAGPVRPYVQGKIVLSDEIEGVIGFGVRF